MKRIGSLDRSEAANAARRRCGDAKRPEAAPGA
jgi:hypothetical protein